MALIKIDGESYQALAPATMERLVNMTGANPHLHHLQEIRQGRPGALYKNPQDWVTLQDGMTFVTVYISPTFNG